MGDLVYFAHLLETPSVSWYMKACRVQQSIRLFWLPDQVSLKPISQWTFGGSVLTTIKMTFQWNTLWKCYYHSNVLLYTRKLRPKVVTYIVPKPFISTPLNSVFPHACATLTPQIFLIIALFLSKMAEHGFISLQQRE